MPQIILFDIDLTLITTNGAGRTAIETAFEKAFGVPNATEGVSFDGRTDHGIFMELIVTHHVAGPDPMAAYRRMVEAYLGEIEPSLMAREGTILPGVPEILATMRETHKLGLATGNLRRGAEAKLRHYGIWEHFAGGGFGDNSPVRAELVRHGIEEMAALLGIEPDPHDCIVLGDTPLDVEAAHLAGARALAVATGRSDMEALTKSGAEWVLPDLSNTKQVLEILRS